MKTTMIRVALMLAVALLAMGQPRREVGHVDDPARPDVAHFTVTVIREYESIASLFSDSHLVIQGNIKSVSTRDLPTSSGRTHNIVTDFVVDVTRTFKGPSLSQIAVVQMGGINGNVQRIPEQFRMMQRGEQYVLFLRQDTRLQSPALASFPTYSVTGAYAGLFQIVNNVLQLSPATHASLRGRYEGQKPDLLLSDLESVSH